MIILETEETEWNKQTESLCSSNPCWDFLLADDRCRPIGKGLYCEILLFQNGLNY